jgi:Ca2+-binding RTX toxin-like protein
MAYVTLNGDYGYGEYWLKGATGTTIDATTADWHVAAKETVPSINIYNSNGTTINGGEIWGEVSQTGNWTDIYNHMSTGFRISNSPNTTIRNVNIDGTWDGIRFIPHDTLNVANGNSNGWLVEDVHMSNIRDDAIENDFAATGTLRDSLLDGVFSAFGTVNAQSAHGVLTVDDSIIVMKDYLKDGEMTHGSPFKFNTTDPGNNPELHIVNTIIAVSDPTHNGFSRLKEAWNHLTESSGNYYLNLSDTKLPSNYPLPPKGFTILQGQAARDFLATQKNQWLAEHDGAQAPTAPTTTAPTSPTPTSPTTTTSGTYTDINGTSGNDTLKGTSGVDHISGSAGDDFIFGKGGSDILAGGSGHDKFVFDTALGSIAQVQDFNPAEDVFYLDNAIFTSLRSGTLSAPVKIYGTNLTVGSGAHAIDSNDFLSYDKSTGHLYYDADGSGAGAPVDFAHLQAGLDLTAANFWMI